MDRVFMEKYCLADFLECETTYNRKVRLLNQLERYGAAQHGLCFPVNRA